MESERLNDAKIKNIPWKKWGPYLSERQWGTVREDYSSTGDAWEYFTHDQARSRAYRWGEDGIAGFSDEKQRLCFSLALWNGKDPILKERLFGLSNGEGNHGEDVKEYYFYLDSTPTHSYMKYLYKYPQLEYPYLELLETNSKKSKDELEYELIDTGIFDKDFYFDVMVEYAKSSPEDILIKITVTNRGPEPAKLSVLPTILFRNYWEGKKTVKKPVLKNLKGKAEMDIVQAIHPELGKYNILFEKDKKPKLLFTENETNNEKLFDSPSNSSFVKDGINDFVVNGKEKAVNIKKTGTKMSALYELEIGSNDSQVIRMRLVSSDEFSDKMDFNKNYEEIFKVRLKEADQFYESIISSKLSKEEKNVFRQAMAGLFWTKQYYYYDVERWLSGHVKEPLEPEIPDTIRNRHWFHMVNDNVISMPDKWEYPWYAAWDLAFHTIPLALADLDFAKEQVLLMLDNFYLHPNGQIPAYEWNFSDVNPPVISWAAIFVYNTEQELYGKGDLTFLKNAFHKLLLNFTWWVNRKDRSGRNVFEGGFLGLDNIGVFDRSKPLPTGGYIEQADGTAWMALFCQNMLQIAITLAKQDEAYVDMALKFVEHFCWIAAAIGNVDEKIGSMWDEEDGFFYDLLRLPGADPVRLKVRSVVGLLPLCAATVIEKDSRDKLPGLMKQVNLFFDSHPNVKNSVANLGQRLVADRSCLAILDEKKLRRVLEKMLDEEEFLSPYGIRSLSKFHQDNPYIFNVNGEEYRVDYTPADSSSGMFGGNSNWRGPIWFPINILIVRALFQYYMYYGDSFKIECPTGSGNLMTLFEVMMEISKRLSKIFLPGKDGKRPVHGDTKKFQEDPHWKDYILFYEYFHGDNGAGLGASHQTGWTGLVARLIHSSGFLKPEHLLDPKLKGNFFRGVKK